MELWKGYAVEKVTLSDGEYWMPVCPSGLYAYATDIYPDNYRGDHELAGVMPDRYNRSWNLVTDDTAYGRQLKLLAEVWNWDNLTDSAAWECLEKRLSEV